MTLSPSIVGTLLLVGTFIGVISGMIGLGGGIMVIPALMFLYGFSQQKANGTSLAMLLPPIGIFAVLTYHKAHNIDWPTAILLSSGFLVGAWVGGLLINTGKVPDNALRILFAAFLLYVATRMILRSDVRLHAAFMTVCVFVGFGAATVLLRLLGRRWQNMPSLPVVYREKLRAPLKYDYEI